MCVLYFYIHTRLFCNQFANFSYLVSVEFYYQFFCHGRKEITFYLRILYLHIYIGDSVEYMYTVSRILEIYILNFTHAVRVLRMRNARQAELGVVNQPHQVSHKTFPSASRRSVILERHVERGAGFGWRSEASLRPSLQIAANWRQRCGEDVRAVPLCRRYV